MFDSYEILKTIHVLAAVVWVGGAVTVNILGTKMRGAGDPARLTAFARDTEWLGQRIYLPSSIVVLAFGIFAVIDGDIGFSTLWVVIGIIGIVLTALTGSLFLGPEAARIAGLADQRGFDDQEVQRRIGRLFTVSRIDLAVLTIVIIDMVVKPTL
jgi:uncharacterized membrane protein